MKKIKVYTNNSFDFHTEVVNSKHYRRTDPTYKDRVMALNGTVKEQFENHDTEFERDNLAILLPKNLNVQEKQDLLSLYNYDSKPFQKLNNILTTSETGKRQPVCPFCTINNVNTFDHLIPKTEFPELSDHPKNLMPCCSECNSKKSSNWRIGNNRRYLNLYLDDLPDIQYLFVTLNIESSTIHANFFIENRFGIDINLYRRIENHYQDLELCRRFAINSYNIISELQNILTMSRDVIPTEDLKNIIIQAENKNREIYGFRNWKSILKQECCTNDNVFNFLIR